MNYDVSIIIPTYNRADKLVDTVSSLVNQSFAGHYEIIIVDSSSTDEAETKITSLIKKYKKIRYFKQGLKGPATARNLGIKKSKYDIIAFIDDDCIAPKNWLERLISGYKRHPTVAGVGGYISVPKEILKNNIFAQEEDFFAREVHFGEKEVVGGFKCPGMWGGNVSFKKKVLNEVNGFDESFTSVTLEDTDLKYRISQRGYKFLYSPIKVIHMQEYNWDGFVKRSWRRGKGSKEFDIKYGKWSILKSFLRIFLIPFFFIYYILINKKAGIPILQNIRRSTIRTIDLSISYIARIVG